MCVPLYATPGRLHGRWKHVLLSFCVLRDDKQSAHAPGLPGTVRAVAALAGISKDAGREAEATAAMLHAAEAVSGAADGGEAPNDDPSHAGGPGVLAGPARVTL